MSLEQRGKHQYYYRKRRVGNQVLSTYFGKGETSALLAGMEEGRRAEKLLKKRAEELERKRIAELEAPVNEVDDLIHALIKGVLLISDHHTHKGEWRQKRYGKERTGNR